MFQSWQRSLPIGILAVAVTQGALAADAGVSGRKLVILDRLFAGKAKVVYVSKLDPGIQKGAAGDPGLLSGTFTWSYTDMPTSVNGSFVMPSSLWIKNVDAVAKFANPDAAIGFMTFTRVTIVKPGIVAKLVALGGGDSGAGNIDDPPSASGGVTTVLTIDNGNDSSTHRMCTKFASDAGSTVIHKEIGGGQGRKLVGKLGVPTACP